MLSTMHKTCGDNPASGCWKSYPQRKECDKICNVAVKQYSRKEVLSMLSTVKRVRMEKGFTQQQVGEMLGIRDCLPLFCIRYESFLFDIANAGPVDS